MSGKLSGQVWDLDLPHAEAWVLMCLADHADHDGKNVRPRLDLIAWKTGYSKRQVQRIMKRLETQYKALIREGFWARGVIVYRIDVSRVQKKVPVHDPDFQDGQNVHSESQDGQNVHGQNVHPDEEDGQNVHSDRQNGQNDHGHFVHSMDIQMSTEPKEEKREDTPPSPPLVIQPVESTPPSPAPHLPEPTEPEEPKPKRKRGRQSSPKTPFPEQFILTGAMRQWARRNGPHVNVDHETKKFAAHWRANGEWRTDWKACWEKWILNQESWFLERHPHTSHPSDGPLEVSL